MENQTLQPSPAPKPSHPVPILILVLLLLVSLGFNAYLYLRGQNPATSPSPASQDSITSILPSPTEFSNSPAPGWPSYKNADGEFTILYPPGWRVVDGFGYVGFGPKDMQEDIIWMVSYYSKGAKSKQALIDEMGSQFKDRRVATDDIIVNGRPAAKVTVTTPQFVDWSYVQIIMESPTKIYAVSNGAFTNDKLQQIPGVPVGTTFEDFYNSMTF